MPSKVDSKEIAKRAYEFYLARGCQDGHAIEDWVRAEQELARTQPSAEATKTKTTARVTSPKKKH